MKKIIFGVVALVIVIPIAVWGISIATAHIRGKADAYRQTETGDYQIQNYERFKDECNSVVAIDVKIRTARSTLARDRRYGVDSFSLRVDAQNLSAITNSRADAITQYNADASKTSTIAKFKDAGLPTYISPTSQIGSISCPSS